MNLHEDMKALLRDVNRDVRRGAWELLVCALALLLFADDIVSIRRAWIGRLIELTQNAVRVTVQNT